MAYLNLFPPIFYIIYLYLTIIINYYILCNYFYDNYFCKILLKQTFKTYIKNKTFLKITFQIQNLIKISHLKNIKIFPKYLAHLKNNSRKI